MWEKIAALIAVFPNTGRYLFTTMCLRNEPQFPCIPVVSTRCETIAPTTN
jgi:hypothetical protein